MADPQVGWGWPGLSRKAHFFVNGQALCGKWLFLGDLVRNQQIGSTRGPDDCAECWRQAKKREESVP